MISKDKLRIGTTISKDIYARLEEYSVRLGVPKSALMAIAISQYLDQQDVAGLAVKQMVDRLANQEN